MQNYLYTTLIPSHRRFTATLVALALLTLALPAVVSAAPSGKVNINTATAEQLELLPRVGPSISQRILEYREANGQFETAEDLMLVRGIGEKTYEGMAAFLALDGETTLAEKVRPSRASESTSEE